MNDLKQGFKNYIAIDDQITAIEARLADMRKERERVEKSLLQIIEKNNLQKKEIKIANARFQYTVSDRKDGFTQQYVKQALYDYFDFYYDGKLSREKCKEKADHVFQYLMANRTVKHKVSLKRLAEKPESAPVSDVSSIGSVASNTSVNSQRGIYKTIQ